MSEIKRYVVRCEICHRVVRKAKPDARYCGSACKQVAWRRGKAKRDAEAEATALAEAERQRQRAEALRQQRAEALRQQRAAEQQRQFEAERKQREEIAQQQRAEAKAKHQQHLLKYIPPCPKCGKQKWSISREPLLFGLLFGLGKRLRMKCTACYEQIKPTVSPSPCPVCNLHHESFTLDADGTLTCTFCKQELVWGEWIGNWQPEQPARLAPGHSLDNLKHQRPFKNLTKEK